MAAPDDKLSQKTQALLGLPPGFKIYGPQGFGGLANAASRMGIPENKFWWIENLVKIGEYNLRAIRDNGTAIYTASGGKQIVNHFFYNIGTTEYAVVFLNDGTAYQVNVATQAITTISSTVNTFYKAGFQLTGCSQFAAQYLLMSNNITKNSYWVWDGSLLYTAGTVSPQITVTNGGLGYTSAPTVEAYGGSGSGSTYLATVDGGVVTNVVVTNPGSGYQPTDQVQLRFSGGGTDNGAELIAELNGNVVASATVTNGGSGYTAATTVTISGGGGTGALASPQIIGGVITAVIINNGGSGFTSTPTITITDSGGGSGASAQANLSGYVIGSISVTATGSGFTSAPTVTINGGGGTGATAVAYVSNGQIVSVAVTNPGYGYTTAPVVNYSGGGGSGNNLTANLVTSQGMVVAVNVTNPGSGYTFANISFTGGNGSNAAATAVITGGQITAIQMTNQGTGYTSPPMVVITGDGVNAAGSAVLNSGYVMGISVVHAGTGYSSPPILTLVGGGGTGATAVATVLNGSIVAATITNPGKGYQTTPAVVIQTGLNSAASATINLMPYGVSGTSIENYQQRVWDVNPHQSTTIPVGNVLELSATESLSDFATSDGGLLYTATESTLRIGYTALKQTNGYLYAFGDSEVSVISGVNSSGNPVTTTFNYQNSDPQIGAPWRDGIQAYGRALIFANQLGIFGLYGGGVSKLSEEIDNIFINAIVAPTAGALTPSSAVATFFKRRIYCLLITLQDPFTLEYRNAIIGWDGKEFYILSQSTNLTYISTQEVNTVMTAWGTDGTSLFPLFNQFTDTLPKILQTKLYGADSMMLVKEALAVYCQAQDLSGTGAGINFSSFTVDNNFGSYQVPNPINITSPAPQYQLYAAGAGQIPGPQLGITLNTVSPNFTINYLGLGYIPIRGVFGSDIMVSDTSE